MAVLYCRNNISCYNCYILKKGNKWARKFKNTNRTVFKTFQFLINVKEISSLQIPLII
jgi:hypothetical protein